MTATERDQALQSIPSRGTIVLIACGLVSLFLYALLARERAWSEPGDVYRFLLLMAAAFAGYGGALVVAGRKLWDGGPLRSATVFFFAALFRLALLPAGTTDGWSGVLEDLRIDGQEPAYGTYQLYDNDVWRYLWDGRVLLGGVNTYRLSPAQIEELADDGDPRFAWLDDEPWGTIHSRIGYASYRTVYPPLAQAVFTVLAALRPGSVAALKILLILVDLGSCWLLFDLARRTLGQPELALVYAWNPLAIKEIAGSAHIDGLAVFGLVLALWAFERAHFRWSLLALAGAILSKLTPLLAVPLFLRRTPRPAWWVLPAAGIVAYAPFVWSLPVMAESLRAFAQDWGFNAGFWHLNLGASHRLGWSGRGAADAASLFATLAVVVWASWRVPPDVTGLARRAGLVLGAYVLLSATVMPWYLLWALPLLALGHGKRGPVFLWPMVTAASLLSYGVYIDGVERASWLWIEHSLIAAAFLLLTVQTLRRRG